MIRRVKSADAEAIAGIYNEYVLHGVATFDTEPVQTGEMRERIAAIADAYPYLVYESGGRVAGYCYAHAWKEKAAYRHTLETTAYLSPAFTGRGIGRRLMEQLIEECRQAGYRVLVACITGGNEASIALHRKLGFKQVSRFEQVGLKFGQLLDVVDYELVIG